MLTKLQNRVRQCALKTSTNSKSLGRPTWGLNMAKTKRIGHVERTPNCTVYCNSGNQGPRGPIGVDQKFLDLPCKVIQHVWVGLQRYLSVTTSRRDDMWRPGPKNTVFGRDDLGHCHICHLLPFIATAIELQTDQHLEKQNSNIPPVLPHWRDISKESVHRLPAGIKGAQWTFRIFSMSTAAAMASAGQNHWVPNPRDTETSWNKSLSRKLPARLRRYGAPANVSWCLLCLFWCRAICAMSSCFGRQKLSNFSARCSAW